MKPANAYAKVNESVTFDCTITEPEGVTIVHIWRAVEDGAESSISVDGEIQNPYKGIFEIEDGSNLKLISASLDNGHMYKCDETVSSAEFSAQLIVLSKYQSSI